MNNIICIDGPSGAGKGSVGIELSRRLGWNFLDSGAMYRVLALAATKSGFNLDQPEVAQLTALAKNLGVKFNYSSESQEVSVILEQNDVTREIRSESAGNNASKVAAIPEVRSALLQRQRDFATEQGLIADGRDMGTVVFPNANLKLFLTASANERAKRRYKQLNEKGIHANISQLEQEIAERDERDRSRTVSPLLPAEDAITIDCTSLNLKEVVDRAWQECKGKNLI